MKWSNQSDTTKQFQDYFSGVPAVRKFMVDIISMFLYMRNSIH